MSQIDKDRNIVRLVNETGLKHSCAGYEYLIACVRTVMQADARSFKVKDIYNYVAKEYGVKFCTIERALRIAIQRSSDEKVRKLTNKELISQIVDQLIS